MSRVIKFRFWNKKTKCMYADTGLSSLGVNDGLDLALEYGYEVMQYTGLKDKNRKEIFEGDIIEVPEDETFSQRTRLKKSFLDVVIFKHGSFEASKSDFGYEGEDVIHLNLCSVVGNIHENPELLERG